MFALLVGRPPPLADVAAYRMCGKKVLESVRYKLVEGKNIFVKEDTTRGKRHAVTKALIDYRNEFMAEVFCILLSYEVCFPHESKITRRPRSLASRW